MLWHFWPNQRSSNLQWAENRHETDPGLDKFRLGYTWLLGGCKPNNEAAIWEFFILPIDDFGHGFLGSLQVESAILVGGFNPSEKYEFVNWDDEISNIWTNNKCSKPPTSYEISETLHWIVWGSQHISTLTRKHPIPCRSLSWHCHVYFFSISPIWYRPLNRAEGPQKPREQRKMPRLRKQDSHNKAG